MRHEGSFCVWESVLQALAEELSAVPQPTREELVQRLVSRCGYETIESGFPGDEAHNARAVLIQRLAGRLALAETPSAGRGREGEHFRVAQAR